MDAWRHESDLALSSGGGWFMQMCVVYRLPFAALKDVVGCWRHDDIRKGAVPLLRLLGCIQSSSCCRRPIAKMAGSRSCGTLAVVALDKLAERGRPASHRVV